MTAPAGRAPHKLPSYRAALRGQIGRERTDGLGLIPVLAAGFKYKLDPPVPHPALRSQGDPGSAPERPEEPDAKRAGLGAPERRGERGSPEG